MDNYSSMTIVSVNAIFASEFNIDTGTELISQYPSNFLNSFEEYSCIADYMIPEGSHNVEYDWNIFKLIKETVDTRKDLDEGWELVGESSDIYLGNNRHNISNVKDAYFCLNLVHTRRDSNLRRGAKCRALAICCSHQHFHIFKRNLWNAFDSYFTAEKEKIPSIIEDLYTQLNSINIDKAIKIKDQYQDFWCHFNGIKDIDYLLPLNQSMNDSVYLPLHYLYDETDDSSIMLLLQTFKEQTMIIYDAVLSEKSVLFHGYNLPSWFISKFAQSASILTHPIPVNFKKRVFPFVHLASISFTRIQGYIAGCNNPMFQEGEFGWDIYCDINTGKILDKSKNYKMGNENYLFIKRVLAGMNVGKERWVREQFQIYTQSIIEEAFIGRQSQQFEEKVLSWRHTESYKSFIENNYIDLTKNNAFHSSVRKIKNSKNDVELEGNLKLFVEKIKNDQDIIEATGVLGLYKINLKDIINNSMIVSENTKQRLIHIYESLPRIIDNLMKG